MKVLFVSNDPAIFDSTSAVRARMRVYAEKMGELHIISAAQKDAKQEAEANLFLYPIHTGKVFRIRALTALARTIVLEKGIQVVSAQDAFEHGLAALRAVEETQAKLHIQIHTDFLSPWFVRGSLRTALLNQYRRMLADKILPRASGIRVVSERIKDSLRERYGARVRTPVVIPAAFDATMPPPAPFPESSFSFTLITVGRLESEKRIENILHALSQVVNTYPKVGLYIVGDGRDLAFLKRRVQMLKLTKNVVFLGNRKDARALMQSADAFIQASAYEGYGFTLLEAGLAHVPIITTDVGIIGEVYEQSKDALVYKVGDVAALKESIQMLIKDGALRERLVAEAQASAHRHLSAVGDIPNRIQEDLERLSR